jgi:putative membrane protein
MADSREYITRYVKYFNLKAPSSFAQAMILFLIGAIAGIISSFEIHGGAVDLAGISVSGMSTGIFIVSIPALLTVVLLKTAKRTLKLKHAMLSVMLITIPYALLIILDSFIFDKTANLVVAYLFLMLVNAGIYGYWFIVSKFLIGRRNLVIFLSAVQPVINVMFFIPMEGYLLNTSLPLALTLVKLSAGMVVFLVAGYAFLFIIDRPVKKTLETSGVSILSAMVGQWLFNLTNDVKVIGYGAGVNRKLDLELLMLKGKKNFKGIFVNPDIHFGPFQGVGGSVAPLQIGDLLVRKYNSAPFVLHGTLDIQDNPIITSQVYSITKKAESMIGETKEREFERAYGTLGLGEDGRCRAVNLKVGNSGLLILTKAPYVTEDMTREVGISLKATAIGAGLKNSILVDAHNSRFESASADELDGIKKGNPYVAHYQRAIELSVVRDKERVSFGAAYGRIATQLNNPKDIGEGYTSVCVFKFGRKRKFCVFYFDANNVLPEFRNELLEHVKKKYGMDAELCTTDTHSINTLSKSASTTLGRYTRADKAISVLDPMVKKALKDMEPVSYAYKKGELVNFPVWGSEADKLIEQTSSEVKKMLKYVAPVLVVFAFILAAWAIYVI